MPPSPPRRYGSPLKVGETLRVATRWAWRSWLARNHAKKREIWLVYARSGTGPRVSYNAAVEEALCYGWIDSTLHRLDDRYLAQRFSPRRATSALSPMNRERVRELIRKKKMTRAGLAAIAHAFDPTRDRPERLVLAPDVSRALRKDPQTWRAYQALPARYQRIRVAYIEHARARGRDEFERRLRHFVKMTAAGKRIGFVRD